MAVLGVAAAAHAEPYTNRLIASSDPYLRLHAHNPVDWYPWGPEAFAKAKAENKPIFLSIGYSTCYWCHVAEKTIYSDPAIAALMNKWFVNVKVDREERPDVDRLYIIATEMLTQHGAWPNNLFLTPDLKPFYAGSYFPPKDDPGGTMGFPSVLAAIHDLWEHHRAEKVDPAVDELYGALSKVAAAQHDRRPVPVDGAAWVAQASEALLRSADPVNGGFGSSASGPKFPQAPALDLVLAAATIGHDVAARDALLKALDGMAYGGIHDQLGGGFHRYSSDPSWTIPHFEKSLADNAQLLALYARAFALTKDATVGAVTGDIAGYLIRDMQAPAGGFYTAQDAAIDGHEGADYLWSRAEIEQALGPVATERFLAVYEIAPLPDAPEAGAPGVLRIRLPLAGTLARSGAPDVAAMIGALAPERDKLLAVRRARPQPPTDIKVVTGLNGLAIGALAEAGSPADIAAARKAAERIWTAAFDRSTGALAHALIGDKAEGEAYVEDYAMFGQGLLDLATATHEATDLDRARTIAAAMLTRFQQPDGRLSDARGLIVALADDSDTDVPSGTSAAIALLSRLGTTTAPDASRFAAAAARLARAVSGQIAARPTAWPSAIAALGRVPLPEAARAAPPAPTAPSADPKADLSRVPATSDHVHVSAQIQGDTIAVTLVVDPGYHINAHKPSFDYLVPTSLSFAPMKPSNVSYPHAVRFTSAFAPGGLDVYEGTVPLVARFPSGVLSGVMGLEGRVSAQACDAKTCLPPAQLSVTVANPG